MPRTSDQKPAGPAKPAPAPAAGRSNTLGLEERQLDALLDQFDGGDSGAGSIRRRYARRSFRRIALNMAFVRPDGHVSPISVACRNLSRGGMSVLHCAFIHPGTRCLIALPRAGNEHLRVVGKVARCSHRKGMVHELGIAFDKPIDTREILSSAMFSDWFSLENVNPAELTGSILYVDDNDADRMLVRHYLRETSLSITTAETAAIGVEKAMDGFDVIIADYNLGESTGATMLAEIRARGVQAPVILVTADTTAASPQEFATLNASAYLVKPIDARLLLRAIAEFLVVQQGGPATLSLCSTLKPDDANATLLDEYVENLHTQSEKLKAEMKAADPRTCRQICAGIKGAAPSMGFAAIGELAERAMKLLAGAESIGQSQPHLSRLADACARAHVKKAA